MSFLDLIVCLLLLKNIPFMKVVGWFIYLFPIEGHLGSSQCLAVVNKSGMNIWVQVLCEYTFFPLSIYSIYWLNTYCNR